MRADQPCVAKINVGSADNRGDLEVRIGVVGEILDVDVRNARPAMDISQENKWGKPATQYRPRMVISACLQISSTPQNE